MVLYGFKLCLTFLLERSTGIPTPPDNPLLKLGLGLLHNLVQDLLELGFDAFAGESGFDGEDDPVISRSAERDHETNSLNYFSPIVVTIHFLYFLVPNFWTELDLLQSIVCPRGYSNVVTPSKLKSLFAKYFTRNPIPISIQSRKTTMLQVIHGLIAGRHFFAILFSSAFKRWFIIFSSSV